MKVTTIRGEVIDLVPGITLQGTLLRDLNLAGIDLHGSVLRDCYFNESNLTGANLRDCDLRGAVFYRTNLTGVDLTGAMLDDECYWKEALLDDTIRWPRGVSEAPKLTNSERRAIRVNEGSRRLPVYFGDLCAANFIPRDQLFDLSNIQRALIDKKVREIGAHVQRSRSFVPPECEGRILPLSSEENEYFFRQLALNIFKAFKYLSHDGEYDVMEDFAIFDTRIDFSDVPDTPYSDECLGDAILFTHVCHILIALGLRFERIVGKNLVIASMRPTWDMRTFAASDTFRLFESLYYYEISGRNGKEVDINDHLAVEPTDWHHNAFAPTHAVLQQAGEKTANRISPRGAANRRADEIQPIQAILASILSYFHFAASSPDSDRAPMHFEEITMRYLEELVLELLGIEEAEWLEPGVLSVKMTPPMEIEEVLELLDIMELSDGESPDFGIAWPSLGIFRHFLP